MSIIADTLQRLQTQAKGEASDAPDTQAFVMPAKCKREPGWHTPPSRLKFWLAGMVMAIGLSGLGLVAYWIGFNLDFGMSTFASPRISQSNSLSVPSPLPEIPPIDSPSPQFMPVPVPHSVQDSPSSAPQQHGGVSSTIQDPASVQASGSPNTDIFLPTQAVEETPVSSETKGHSLSPLSRQIHQRTVPTNVSTTNSATDFPPKKESAEPKAPSTSLPSASPEQSDTPASKLVESKEVNVIATDIPVVVAMEKESMGREEFPSLPRRSIDETLLLPNTTAMIPRKEKPPQSVEASVPAQPSSVNRLPQAQQLIQAGNYKEAVSVLSPLFKDPPINWEPWFWMGTALLGQNDLEEADQFFLSGLARNDKIPQLWIQRALVAHQRGEYQLAIHELRRAESLDAALPHTHLNMGYAYEKLGNNRLANEYYSKFLKLSEGNPAFFSIRKKLYARFTEQVHSTPNPSLPSSISENPQRTKELSGP